MDCDLEVFLEGRLLRRVPLGADATNIGRDTTNEVVLNGAAVADFHARVVGKGDRYILSDLSTRGTFMRGGRVVTQQVVAGDEFYIGPYVFRVIPRSWSVHESASKPPPRPAPTQVSHTSNPGLEPPPWATAAAPVTTGPAAHAAPVPDAEPAAPAAPTAPAAHPAAAHAAAAEAVPTPVPSNPALTPAPPRRTGKTAILPPPPAPIDLSGLIGLFEVKPLLEALLHHTIPVFRAGRGVVMLVKEGGLSPVVARQGQSSPVQESFSTSVCRRALTSGKHVLIPAIDPGAEKDLVELAEGCPAALMALPLSHADAVVGVLYLECDRATPPAFHDRPTLEFLMKHAGHALAAALEHEAIAADAKRWRAHLAEERRIRPLADVVTEREREHIEAMLERTKGEIADAARLLGVNRQTLQHRMRKLGIRLPKP